MSKILSKTTKRTKWPGYFRVIFGWMYTDVCTRLGCNYRLLSIGECQVDISNLLKRGNFKFHLYLLAGEDNRTRIEVETEFQSNSERLKILNIGHNWNWGGVLNWMQNSSSSGL